MLSGSFVKALKGVLDSIPKIIKVTFVHADGHEIGMCKIDSTQLPEKFWRPAIIEAFGRPWRVLNADPYKDFIYKKKLTLVVVEPELAHETTFRFFHPTVAGIIPASVSEIEHNGFIVDMAADEWRQVELLPSSFLPLVTAELEIIESIRNPGKGISVLSGYKKRHIREKINPEINNISLEEFCKLLGDHKRGAVIIHSSKFVKDGFAIQSGSFTYYGTMQENVIKDLCVHAFDFPDSELLTVLSTFDLLLVNWCEGGIITAEVTEATESDIIPANDQVDF